MDTQTLGRLGEDTAARLLISRGFRILHRNLRIGHAEIDLVAENGAVLVFAEVKTRRQIPGSPSPFGTPAEAVDAKKQAMLVRAAEAYLAEHAPDKFFRIDVIEVYADPQSADYRVLDVRHFENAVRKNGKFSRKSPTKSHI